MTVIAAFALGWTALVLRRRHRGLHPAFLLAGIWAVTFALLSVPSASIGLDPPSWKAVALVLLGVGAFCIVPLLAPAASPRQTELKFRKDALALSTLAVFLLFLAGYMVMARTIASAAGADFGQLTLTEIRYYQTAEERSGGGALGLLYALAPLSASLLALSARLTSRLWYLGLAPVALLVAQSPARTAGLTAMLGAVLFITFTRPGIATRLSPRRVAWAILVAVLAVGYFVVVGSLLGKDRAASQLSTSSLVPLGLVTPELYLTGGVSALAYAQEYGLASTEWGRSIYAALRLGEAVGLPVSGPETLAEYVPIPVPFNVFTAFGDLWMDFGYPVTFLVCLICGYVAHRVYLRARGGSLVFAWLAALAGTWALSTPMTFRPFYLDSVFLAVAGSAVFAVVQPAHRDIAKDRARGRVSRRSEQSPDSFASRSSESGGGARR